MNPHKSIVLNDHSTIPRIGLGVFLAKGEDARQAVKHALEVGYRHIDTAAAYKNEEEVGLGVAASGVPRQDIFITSKIWTTEVRSKNTLSALEQSLERLNTDYLDLCLIHWPAEGRVQAWRDLIEAKSKGQVRSIGVSNFTPEQLDEIVNETNIVPVLNQIEFHPYLNQPEILEACERHQVQIEAWSPLMQGQFVDEPLFTTIAERHQKTAAQVVLRWSLQRGMVIIPKSITPSRIEENFDLFDFELSHTEMTQINALERKGRIGPSPYTFDF